MNTFSKHLTTLTTASVAAFTLTTNVQAADLTVFGVLDPFDVDQAAFNNAGDSQIGPSSATIPPFDTSFLPFNLERIIDGQITAGSTALANSVVADSNISELGSFSVANGPNRQSEISVFYEPEVPLNILDLTVNGQADRLIVNVTANDLPMDLIFNFTDGFGFSSNSIGIITPGNITADNPTMLTVLFSEFPQIDFSFITEFSFEVNTRSQFPAADITFDFFAVGAETPPPPTTTPEPKTVLGLIAVGGFGLVSGRRQKKSTCKF